jgi:ribosomal-protein-alanine N-acetyltransferase
MLTEGQFALRMFTPEHLQAVVEINRICLPENYASFFFLDTYNSCPEAFLVAESNDRVVGYVMCRLEHGFSESRKFRFAKKGHIISVAVLPDFRRLGIGQTLVERSCGALAKNGAEECYLEVRTSNQEAILLYQKLNFEIVRKIPHYYFDGSDAYVMTKSLDGPNRTET